MKVLIALLMMVFAFAARAQLSTSRCVFVEKTSGRVPLNTILYPQKPVSAVLYPPPAPTRFTNGTYAYQKAPDYRPVEDTVDFDSFIREDYMTNICFRPVFCEGTNRFECSDSGIYVCGNDSVELSYTNIVVTETEGFPKKQVKRKISSSWSGGEGESYRVSVDGYAASTNLLSGSELEAKGIKILFKEVLSIEMVETNGVLRPIVFSRWVPYSESPRKPVAELMGL